MKETACFKFMKQDCSELPDILSKCSTNKTMDYKTLKRKVLITPVTPHQKGTLQSRLVLDRKGIVSENQHLRKQIHPINMKYKDRVLKQNEHMHHWHNANEENIGKLSVL